MPKCLCHVCEESHKNKEVFAVIKRISRIKSPLVKFFSAIPYLFLIVVISYAGAIMILDLHQIFIEQLSETNKACSVQ